MFKRKPMVFKIRELTLVVGGTKAQRSAIIGDGAISGNQFLTQFFAALDQNDNISWYEFYRDAPMVKIAEFQELRKPEVPSVSPIHEDYLIERWDMETYLTILLYRFAYRLPTVVGMDNLSFFLKRFLPFYFRK